MWKAVSWRSALRGAHWNCLQLQRRKGTTSPELLRTGISPDRNLSCSARKQEEYKDESTWPCMTIFYRRKLMFFLRLPDFYKSYLKNSLNRMVNDGIYLSECFGNRWRSFGFAESGTVLKIMAECHICGSEPDCHKWKLKCGFTERATIYLYCK